MGPVERVPEANPLGRIPGGSPRPADPAARDRERRRRERERQRERDRERAAEPEAEPDPGEHVDIRV